VTKTITSPESGKRYQLTINDEDGHATGCSCPDRNFRRHTCKHMRAHEAERHDAERSAYLNWELSMGL
jgi:uncharacterized Zn finger protein